MVKRSSIGVLVAVLAGVSPAAGCGAGSGAASTIQGSSTAEVAGSATASQATLAKAASAPAGDAAPAKPAVPGTTAPGSRVASKPRAAPSRAPAAMPDQTQTAHHATRSAGVIPAQGSSTQDGGKARSPKTAPLGGLRSHGATACKQLAASKHRLTAKRRARLKALCTKLLR